MARSSTNISNLTTAQPYFTSSVPTNFSDPAAEPNVTYYYALEVFNGDGAISNFSNIVEAIALPPPEAPTNLTIDSNDGLRVAMSWDEHTSEEVVEIRIYHRLGEASFDTQSPLAILSGNATTYEVNEVNEQETHSFVLTALDNSSRESDFSAEIQAVIPDGTAPTILEVSLVFDSDGDVFEIGWAASTDEDFAHYEIILAPYPLHDITAISPTATIENLATTSLIVANNLSHPFNHGSDGSPLYW